MGVLWAIWVQQRVESICDACRPILAEKSQTQRFQKGRKNVKANALVESDVLHMHACQEVQVRARVLKRVDHVMRDIRAGSRLVVDPSALQKYNVTILLWANAGDYART